MAKTSFTVRLDDDLLDRLRKATVQSGNPYTSNMTQVVARGVELALREKQAGNGKFIRKRKDK